MAPSHVIKAEGGDSAHSQAARDEIAPQVDTFEALASSPYYNRRSVPITDAREVAVEVSSERAREMGFWGMNETDWTDVTDLVDTNLFKRDIITTYNTGRAYATCAITGRQLQQIEACCQVNPDSRSASIIRTSKCRFRVIVPTLLIIIDRQYSVYVPDNTGISWPEEADGGELTTTMSVRKTVLLGK